MVIENGILRIVAKTGGGIRNGVPIPVTEGLGEPLPCNIRTVKHDNKGRTIDNVFAQCSYVVFIEIETFRAETVELTDNRNNNLGKFKVQDIQHLDAVGVVKIVV